MTNEELLAGAPLFAKLKKGTLKRITKVAVRRSYKPGQVIVKEGEFRISSYHLQSFYIIVSGKAQVVKGLGKKEEAVLATLGPKEFFGEMSLFDDYPRSASVIAKEDTECLVLERRRLLAEIRSHPEMAFPMLAVLSRRLREVEKATVE